LTGESRELKGNRGAWSPDRGLDGVLWEDGCL